jgi:hypothetical protein
MTDDEKPGSCALCGSESEIRARWLTAEGLLQDHELCKTCCVNFRVAFQGQRWLQSACFSDIAPNDQQSAAKTDSLADSLQCEIVRVRDVVLPVYDGTSIGITAATMMRQAIGDASIALAKGDAVAMLRAYNALSAIRLPETGQ